VRLARGGEAAALPVLAMLLHHQADAFRRAGQLDEARRTGREAVDMYRAHPAWSPGEAQHADQILDEILTQRGELGEAETVLRASVERARGLSPPDERQLSSSLAILATNLLKQRHYADAEVCLRECADIRARILPDSDVGHWRLHLARSMLGGALVGQAGDSSVDAAGRLTRLREAEPLLVDAYIAMKEDPRVPAPTLAYPVDRRREALQRVVELYQTWQALEPGHEVQSREWKVKLDSEPAGPSAAQPAGK